MENAAAALKALDMNGDGKLTASELDNANETTTPGPDGRRRPVGGPFMRVLDADHNSELSAEEMANAPAALKAADADKEGRLTRQEVDAAGGAQNRGNRRGGGRNGQGPGARTQT